MKRKLTKRMLMFIAGLTAMAIGMSILGFFGVRRIVRDVQRQKLMRENVAIEIPELKIKAPVLEGTDQEVLSKAAGHFPETGALGSGNYCIAGHSSVIYKEYFNNLKNVSEGMEICLIDRGEARYTYTVTESFIVEPNETWVLGDFGDDRVTLVTCTDDGTQRRIIVGLLDKTTGDQRSGVKGD